MLDLLLDAGANTHTHSPKSCMHTRASLQAEMLLGATAEHVADLRAKDETAYKALLSGAQWCEWKMTVMTKRHDYKGEGRLRHQVGWPEWPHVQV